MTTALKECKFYKKINNDEVQCLLCPHKCIIKKTKTGLCGVRININNKLKCLNFSKLTAIALDPIEKKPLFHFYPGEKTLSIGSFGCNLKCKHCQNFEISNIMIGKYQEYDVSPEMVIELAKSKNSKIISYTYNEPTVFYEFVLETAKLAKKQGLKNVIVSNGYINKDPLLELIPYIDAANIDLKAFNNKFYKEITKSTLEPVLETLKILSQNKIHLEITYLVIPGLNDSDEEIRNASKWIFENLGNIPIHFTKFFPMHQLKEIEPTPTETLKKAKHIAESEKLSYIYLGNINYENKTLCPKCKRTLILRKPEQIQMENEIIKTGKCICGEMIYGYF